MNRRFGAATLLGGLAALLMAAGAMPNATSANAAADLSALRGMDVDWTALTANCATIQNLPMAKCSDPDTTVCEECATKDIVVYSNVPGTTTRKKKNDNAQACGVHTTYRCVNGLCDHAKEVFHSTLECIGLPYGLEPQTIKPPPN